MRYQIMQPIEGTDTLAQLFNEYLNGLSTPMIFSEPSYTTMAEVREYTITKPRTKEAKNFRYCAQRYYELLILRQSLESIHDNVLKAIALLESFYATYEDNLLAFALDTRRKLLDEYGSEDETDWEEDGYDEQGEKKWKITHKDDPESLQDYTLHAELGRFFGGESCGRGEYIGTSNAADFYPSTGMVAQQSEFSFRKMAEGAWGATLVRVSEDGSTEPIPLADHIEAEMNEDIRSASLVERFNAILTMCLGTAGHYQQMHPDNLQGYEMLHFYLQKVRDVSIPKVFLTPEE